MRTNQADEPQTTENPTVQDLPSDSDEGEESSWSERVVDAAIGQLVALGNQNLQQTIALVNLRAAFLYYLRLRKSVIG